MMKKHDEDLFRIGEAAKILGITRKAILGYEDMGLLTPAVKDEDSGYRYYSADNMTQIRSIKSLQALGLSLKEVREYYYDTENMDKHLQRLYELRATLDRNIQMLQVRSAKRGDLTVHKTTLPGQVCFCRQYQCRNTAEAANNLRDTYIAAARTGKMSMLSRMFTMRMTQDPGALDTMCCIPVDSSFKGPERMEIAETPALCIYYRGPYEGTATAIRALAAHIKENGIETTGPFRSVYLEGPPSRGDHAEDYITQIAVPIKAKICGILVNGVYSPVSKCAVIPRYRYPASKTIFKKTVDTPIQDAKSAVPTENLPAMHPSKKRTVSFSVSCAPSLTRANMRCPVNLMHGSNKHDSVK